MATEHVGSDDERYETWPQQQHPKANLPMMYEIRLRGHLGPQWSSWFGGMDLTLADNGDTVLRGPVADQAALYGLLRKMRDCGLPLLSVVCVDPYWTDKLETKQ